MEWEEYCSNLHMCDWSVIAISLLISPCRDELTVPPLLDATMVTYNNKTPIIGQNKIIFSMNLIKFKILRIDYKL